MQNKKEKKRTNTVIKYLKTLINKDQRSIPEKFKKKVLLNNKKKFCQELKHGKREN